jgi:hypothetical protein
MLFYILKVDFYYLHIYYVNTQTKWIALDWYVTCLTNEQQFPFSSLFPLHETLKLEICQRLIIMQEIE